MRKLNIVVKMFLMPFQAAWKMPVIPFQAPTKMFLMPFHRLAQPCRNCSHSPVSRPMKKPVTISKSPWITCSAPETICTMPLKIRVTVSIKMPSSVIKPMMAPNRIAPKTTARAWSNGKIGWTAAFIRSQASISGPLIVSATCLIQSQIVWKIAAIKPKVPSPLRKPSISVLIQP